MSSDRGSYSAALQSGGVPLYGPVLSAEAPKCVQARVKRERAQKAGRCFDDKGRVQLCYTRMQCGNGGGLNRVTLPRFVVLDRGRDEKGEGTIWGGWNDV
nr:hypothetical protein [uncultured Cohaesibacter sp.]